MAILNIRQLPDDVHARLRVRAAGNGRSMEAEARALLADACADAEPQYIASDGSSVIRDAPNSTDASAPVTVTLDPRQARAASDYAVRHHTTVEDLVRQALDRELAADADAWCDELFALMDAAGGNSQGATWTRDELYER